MLKLDKNSAVDDRASYKGYLKTIPNGWKQAILEERNFLETIIYIEKTAILIKEKDDEVIKFFGLDIEVILNFLKEFRQELRNSLQESVD